MRFASLLLVGALAVGCGHVAVLAPAPQGRVQLEGALGGPMVVVGGRAVPVPLATVGARYGVIDKLDVAAHAHLTTLAFGVGGLDVGGAYQVLVQDGGVPALTLSSRLYGFAGVRGGALGLIDATVAASYGSESFRFYLAPTLLQPFADAATTFSLGTGVAVKLGRTELQLEGRWYQPQVNTRNMAPEWVSVGNLGGVGVVLGLRHLPGEER